MNNALDEMFIKKEEEEEIFWNIPYGGNNIQLE